MIPKTLTWYPYTDSKRKKYTRQFNKKKTLK